MDCKNEKEIYKNNTIEWIELFRANVYMEMGLRNLTILKLSEMADMSVSTLSAFLYGNIRDMRLSNAIKLSKSLGICLDVLVGANTLSDCHVRLIDTYERLDRTSQCFLSWYAEHLLIRDETPRNGIQKVCINPLELKNGYMVLNRKSYTVGVQDKYNGKVFTGFSLPCDFYMPHFCKDEFLLVANDREPNVFETCIIRIGEAIYLAKKRNGKYYSIRDGKFRVEEEYVDEFIGYIVDSIELSQIHDIT